MSRTRIDGITPHCVMDPATASRALLEQAKVGRVKRAVMTG